MPPRPAFEELRENICCLERSYRRFSRTVSIADEVDCRMPFGGLPRGCIHEVKGASVSSAVAFSAILSARIAGNNGNILFIAPGSSLYPLGLLPYGVRLERLLVVSVRRPQDLAWAVLEALRCSQVSVVMTLLNGVNLTDSRRLQLAAENSGATGFLLGPARSAPIAAPITRWLISPHVGQSHRFDEPAWKLDLLYCRGGIPGNWILAWRERQLKALSTPALHMPGWSNTRIVQTAREALAG
jgi:protein ImuA